MFSGCRRILSTEGLCFPAKHLTTFFSLFRKPRLSSLPSNSLIPSSIHTSTGMDLKEVLDVLEQLAPLSLAESWDNVGLLVEPSKPRPVKTILLTNDLTFPVMEEAEALACDLIISYHPPLFRPVKRLVQKDWKQQLAVRAVECGMAVFSPHTSWDSVKGGVNDWLVGGIGSGRVSVLSQALSSSPQKHKLDFTVKGQEALTAVMTDLRGAAGCRSLQYTSVRAENDAYHVSLVCPSTALSSSVEVVLGSAEVSPSLSVLQVQQLPLPGCGQGRLCVLDVPVSVATAIKRMKLHLRLTHLRLALGHRQTMESPVNTVAVCAGSGASVLQGVRCLTTRSWMQLPRERASFSVTIVTVSVVSWRSSGRG
ncbi:NIF3-like protein 1 isoform X2 [Denticeps clupeoides]|uniref:NIF3-like protein 1 isoform X2 n=1 Tax=Denticeps clupeoides TaxID=299321 RepID=UPI0010A35393|nr:NIF3-like protein 1 isoform X2 [Denticeps clupeoides]